MQHKFNPASIALVIGLGNPDLEHRSTYHNVGWRLLDALAGAARFTRNGRAPFLSARDALERRLVKPLTGMNRSGTAVRAAIRHFRIEHTDEMLVVHDDSDLPLGTWKLQFGRGAAGHHGVASVIESLRDRSFWRIRIGIRPPHHPARKRPQAGSFVLAPVTPRDSVLLSKVFSEIAGALESAGAGR